MSLNQSMNIAVSSLKNNQYALTVVSHNIANVNTEGYVRQGVNFEENRYHYNEYNVVGTIKGMNGASISELKDFVDEGALNDLIETNSDSEYANTLADALSGLEDIMDALGDDGLNALLNDFYAAAANLEQYPDDISIRQQFLLCAQNVTDKFNDISTKIDSKKEETIESADGSVSNLNFLFNELAEANKNYMGTGKSSAAQNEIYSVLQEISNYANVTYDTNSNGTVNLYYNNVKVVQGASVNFELEVDKTGGGYSLYLQSVTDPDYKIARGVTESINSGALAAQIEFLQGSNATYTTIAALKTKVDDAANVFATEINNIQTYSDGGTVFAANITTDGAGNLLLEQSNDNLFITSDGSISINAGNISLNSSITDNPWLLAAARIDTSTYAADEWKNAVGNSDNATEISDLQNKKICSYAQSHDTTLSKFLSNVATDIGTDVDYAQKNADVATDVADSSLTNYTNLIGVNVDEELTDLIKYQRSYEASAKLFSTVNEMYETIIGMV